MQGGLRSPASPSLTLGGEPSVVEIMGYLPFNSRTSEGQRRNRRSGFLVFGELEDKRGV